MNSSKSHFEDCVEAHKSLFEEVLDHVQEDGGKLMVCLWVNDENQLVWSASVPEFDGESSNALKDVLISMAKTFVALVQDEDLDSGDAYQVQGSKTLN